jgi:hypothetical protein
LILHEKAHPRLTVNLVLDEEDINDE